MQSYRIIEHTIGGCAPVYYVKATHPWFKKLWMYVGKYTDRYYFTTINDRQTVYTTFEDAHRRVLEHKRYKLRLKGLLDGTCMETKRICGEY